MSGNYFLGGIGDREEYSFRYGFGADESPPPPPTDSGSPPWESPSAPPSPLAKSPWSSHVAPESSYSYTGLMGSLVREEGHIYSLAASDNFLYTGSDSKNIRVWKNLKEYSSFKCNSGLIKAMIIAGDRIFSGHQDSKIRVWKMSLKDPSVHRRIGTLPTFRATIKRTLNPAKYVDIKKYRASISIKHADAISSLAVNEDQTLLYSASWDRTIKVWKIHNSKCLESINAHDDAVNSVVAGFSGLVFSGSADGTIKVWRREMQGKGTKHFFNQTLLKQECAVTALAIDPFGAILYAGSSNGIVTFWERDRLSSHEGLLRGHKQAVLCLATAGNLVFSGSADTDICVWRREGINHVCLTMLSGHSGPVKCLAVEEDKDSNSNSDKQLCMVYSGSLDKSVKIWRVSALATPLPLQAETTHVRAQIFPYTQSFAFYDHK